MSAFHFSELFRQRKICVLIPTYNNAATLRGVITGVMNFTDQIIIVNDGSTDETTKILEAFPGLIVETFPENKGKGYALRKGFESAVARGFDYTITIDSDGQHFPDDIPAFLEALEHKRNAIIIGVRNMEQAGIPGKSSFGNAFSNFWFRVETGYKMSDTQSGFRLYPVKALSHIQFVTRKFEFEIEVLVRAAWSGIEIIEVPVRVFYAGQDERVSHFRPFRDFTRISILNTFLVLIAFLYIKPRDFFRSIKKKTSGRYYQSICSIPMNPIP